MNGTALVPAASTGSASPATPEDRPAPSPPGHAVLAAHAATLVLALGAWAYLDRHLWFFGDEWDFLTRRGLHGATFSIWAPHNEHWSVLPILLWRGLFSAFHLSSYWPYLLPLLFAHVAVVHLVWRRCLRVGADPWVATALALLMALFGTGAEDLTWAFQIGFVGALMFGLLAMDVADRPGALLVDLRGRGQAVVAGGDRSGQGWARGAAVAGCAVASLMCSSVGIATTVGLAALLARRQGWRGAGRVLALPTAGYLVWFALAGRTGLSATGDRLSLTAVVHAPLFVFTNLSNGLGHAAGQPVLGRALAAGLIVWLAWRARALWRHQPAVLATAGAAVVFYLMAALGRDRISVTMSPSRYAYVGFALLVPAAACALSSLPRLAQAARDRHLAWSLNSERRRRADPGRLRGPLLGAAENAHARLVLQAVVALLLLSTAANYEAGVEFAASRTVYVGHLKQQILTSAALLGNPRERALAIDPNPVWASGATAGYLTPSELLALSRRHLLPAAGPVRGAQLLTDESWLDIAFTATPLYQGRFTAGAHHGITVSFVGSQPGLSRGASARQLLAATGPGAAGSRAGDGRAAWPVGPGTCARLARPRPAGPVAGASVSDLSVLETLLFGRPIPVVRFGDGGRSDRFLNDDLGDPSGSGAGGAPKSPASVALAGVAGGGGSFWLSLGPIGGRVQVSLARAWGRSGAARPYRRQAFTELSSRYIVVPPGGHVWVDESVPGDGLVLHLLAGQQAEVCGLLGGAAS